MDTPSINKDSRQIMFLPKFFSKSFIASSINLERFEHKSHYLCVMENQQEIEEKNT